MLQKIFLKYLDLDSYRTLSKLHIPWQKIILIAVFLFGVTFIFAEEPKREDSKPLLRVFPIERKEECEWSIRFDICLRCLEKGKKYAQRIRFFSEGPFREHGCYTDREGFTILD